MTTALAALGVNVATMDVLEVDGRKVVDELLLRLPPDGTAQDVCDVLRVAGADVLPAEQRGSRSIRLSLPPTSRARC